MKLTFIELAVRLIAAMICGCCIGINRGRKNRPAGIRTHAIICMGSALTVILGIYMSEMISQGLWLGASVPDVSRLGAQVVSGIGFIGVGTIIITGKQQVKGLTTAAGLWASACMGLAIGAGFYLAAVIGCLFILVTVVLFSRLEHVMFANIRDVNIYVEFENMGCMSEIIGVLDRKCIKICDIDISKASEEISSDRAVFSLKLPKKMGHYEVITAIAECNNVISVEEL
ncbi:MAG: MgtC/SapB family protein [Ruminococcaceae bacterium]|nr:MgtC/SapB family protein [Oscillospiraceae bacterium]